VPKRHLAPADAFGVRLKRGRSVGTTSSSEDVIARGQGVTVFIQYNGGAACLFRPKTVGIVCAYPHGGERYMLKGVSIANPSADHEKGWNFEAAAVPFVDSLYNTAYRMTRNAEDAEDLVQET